MPNPVFDAVSEATPAITGTTLAWNHTVAAGANRYLVAALTVRADTSARRVPSGVTFNGVAMTLLHAEENLTVPAVAVSLWGLVAPPTGTFQVLATWSASQTIGVRAGCALSFSEVHQTTPMDATPQGAQAATLAPTVAITTVTAGAMVVDAFYTTATTSTPGTGQTARSNRSVLIGAGDDRVGSSTEPAASPGAVTMNWTSATGIWAQVAIALRPSPSGGASIPAILHHLRQMGAA